MKRFHTPSARLALLVGVCAWIVSLLGSQVHETLVQHVICAEHGEVVEVAHDTTSDTAPDSDEHEHGCSFELVPLEQADLAHGAAATAESANLAESSVLARSLAPRGPPLDFAPKTGPPTAG